MERDHAEHQSAGAQLLIVGPAGDQLTVLIQNVVLNEFGVFEVKIIRIVVWEQGWFVMVPDFNCKQVRWIQVLKSIETLTFGNFRQYFTMPPYSMWNPCGTDLFHVKSTWIPHGICFTT